MSEQSYWMEIRTFEFGEDDFLPEDGAIKKSISIDGYRTEDDNEEGCVIAYVIKTLSGDICTVYIDNLARSDAYAQEVINEAIEDLKKDN